MKLAVSTFAGESGDASVAVMRPLSSTFRNRELGIQ
jgi:hypothetical protein